MKFDDWALSMPELVFKWPLGERAVHFDVTETLLAAALRAGIAVENSCQRGDCHRCSAVIVSGQANELKTQHIVGRGDGGLLCQLKSGSDIAVELAHDPNEVLPPAKLYPAKICGLDWLTGDVARLRMFTPKGQHLEYRGGQYIDIIKNGIRRSYSVYSVDPESRFIECHIRLVSGGSMSHWLRHEAKIGDLLQIHGPHGRFILRDHMNSRRCYFLATGTGIVPVLSMFKSSNINILNKLGNKFLIWGNRHTYDIYNFNEFKTICLNYNIELILALSKESFTKKIKYVTHGLPKALSDDYIFASGNPHMVSDAKKMGLSRGLSAHRFYSDAFSFSSAHGDTTL